MDVIAAVRGEKIARRTSKRVDRTYRSTFDLTGPGEYEVYLQAAGHGGDPAGPLFRPLKNPAGQGRTERPVTAASIWARLCLTRRSASVPRGAVRRLIGEVRFKMWYL
jgi:hypothetical protein